jgi:hypothetical protein
MRRDEFIKSYPEIEIISEVKLPKIKCLNINDRTDGGYIIEMRLKDDLISYPFISDETISRIVNGFLENDSERNVKTDVREVYFKIKRFLTAWGYKHGTHKYKSTSGFASPEIYMNNKNDFVLDEG